MNEAPISLGYAIAHVNGRDEILLKSVVALYNLRKRVVWQPRKLLDAELIVLGNECGDAGSQKELLARLGSGQAVLSLNADISGDTCRTFHTALPLRAGGVVACLEQAEAFFLGNRERSDNAATRRGNERTEERAGARRVRLARWPSAKLLNEHEAYVRLAAMLSPKAMTVTELAQRSAQPVAVCRQFVSRVMAAGCAVYLADKPPESAETGSNHRLKGLLGRIRTKLRLLGSPAPT